MPSDDLVRSVLAALAPAAEPWRAAVVATEEELRGILGGPPTPASSAHTLGAFAAGRIDFDRFSGLVSRSRTMEDAALVRLRIAFDTLAALASRPADALFAAAVPAGGRLRDTLGRAVAEVGRAFGAAHEAALARQGSWREAEHGSFHQAFPFASWTRRERRIAPPLVIEVDGAGLESGDVIPYLDGAFKVVLVVRGPCAPAPLVRLVTPGTYVTQTDSAASLAGLVAAPGPGVAAIVPEGAALFTHDPAGGKAPWDRLRVQRMPAEPPRRAVGPWSAEQQTEELRQLAALAMRPSVAAVATGAAALTPAEAAAAQADPAGRLAAWLLEASGAPAA